LLSVISASNPLPILGVEKIMKEWYTYRNSKTLWQIAEVLRKAGSQGWRVPTSEELAEALRTGAAKTAPYTSHYWSNDLASQSPHEGVREQVKKEDLQTKVVVKWHGKAQDSAILTEYGTILVRDV
jgi:hypothetical protein